MDGNYREKIRNLIRERNDIDVTIADFEWLEALRARKPLMPPTSSSMRLVGIRRKPAPKRVSQKGS